MLTPEGFKDKKAVAVLGSCVSGMGSCGSGMGSCSVLGFSWISPAPLVIFNNLCEILDWILDI